MVVPLHVPTGTVGEGGVRPRRPRQSVSMVHSGATPLTEHFCLNPLSWALGTTLHLPRVFNRPRYEDIGVSGPRSKVRFRRH